MISYDFNLFLIIFLNLFITVCFGFVWKELLMSRETIV